MEMFFRRRNETLIPGGFRIIIAERDENISINQKRRYNHGKGYKEHADRRASQCRCEYCTDPYESMNALYRMPIFSGRVY